ncbi:MAG: sigma-70 family RNA polymerase sigma factor [Polyangiaceae bacterium]|nr:sigma-70 family RNA polymerase sigma factor [Polyangiaceae bacterium]
MRASARCGKGKAEDICQEIRLALWELRDLPVTRDEARRVFVQLASRLECRARREVYRQGALLHDAEEFAEQVRWFNEHVERETVRAVALFNALEKLSDHERWLVKECKIDGRTYADVANQVGVSEEAITSRLWRAMARLLAIFEDENGDEKSEKRGAVIAPLAFEFTDVQRAAFSAIWRAEGRVPTFGGGPPDPPGPPPVVPGAPPVPVAPVVSAAVGSAVSAVTIAIVLVLLILVPTSIVAIYYFWDPPLAQTANKGLRAPPVSVVEDVVPLDYVPPRQGSSMQIPAASSSASVQAPTASSSASAQAPTASSSSDTPSLSPPIDPEEMERARRQAPRSLPARKK